MTYKDARPWAKGMKVEVLERRMPPFAAVKGFGDIQDDDALTQEELHIISDWVEGGAPEGNDPKLLPPQPDFKKPQTYEYGKSGQETVVSESMILSGPGIFVGVRGKNLDPGSSLQAIAEKPDGTVEPIIWLYNFTPNFDRAYYFRNPLSLPAGTKIRVFPSREALALIPKK